MIRAPLPACALALAASLAHAAPRPALDLAGYQDRDGAIAVQEDGDTVDPYFALQALLLAQRNGMDIEAPARRWVAWLLPRQKPDATFDRFCRRANVWAPCKTADADDALLSMWMQLLEALPGELRGNATWRRSHAASAVALERLKDAASGLYQVSPIYPHALLIDNLEVAWRLAPGSPQARRLSSAIRAAFWDAGLRRFRVTTQPHQPGDAFYPEAVAQIFPLVTRSPALPLDAAVHYRAWMDAYRGRWLAQGRDDFAWGIIATVSLAQGDRPTAACWLREALPLRGGPHWTVGDEVARQLLAHAKVAAAPPQQKCA